MLWSSVAFLALVATAQGRAVNISNTWVLPEEGFPVFYRYFRDRISWYEADAVCQFHHANLVTVDTTAQYDAVRAYLKELDISSAVWVGLIRSNPDGDFTWTDYRGLSGDGYWSAAPDARTAPLCAAADPAADYRWGARACGGPTVASFICELPVPQWALGNEGCMVRALPALTVLYLPESAAVQLTADCGLAGVKRIECTGNVKREDLLKNLKCTDEEEVITTQNPSSITSTWVGTTSAVFTDQDTTTDITTDENFTTEHEDDINQSTTSPMNYDLNVAMKYKLPNKFLSDKKFNKIDNNVDLNMIHYNNLQSNYIPKLANDNHLTNEQLEKIEDEKHIQHKMLHEEIARLGNLENIFTQPTDHFVPPLVMAKAKISDDMIVLSLQQKHAQQLAEKYNVKKIDSKNYHIDSINNKLISIQEESKKVITDEPLVITMQPTKVGEILKKDKNKSSIPKKYIEKFYDPKSKIWKTGEFKATQEKVELSFIQTENTNKETTTTANIVEKYKYDDNSSIDLTVTLNDTPKKSNELVFVTNYTDHISKLEVVKSNSSSNNTDIKLIDIEATEEPIVTAVETLKNSINNITLTHELVNNVTTYFEDDISSTPIVIEIATKLHIPEENISISNQQLTVHLNNYNEDVFSTHINLETAVNYNITTPSAIIYDTTTAAVGQEDNNTANITIKSSEKTSITTNEMIFSRTVENSNIASEQIQENIKETFTSVRPFSSTSSKNIIREDIETTTFKDIDSVSILSTRTEYHDENSTNTNSSEIIDDFQSPLLSGANEPLHRPNRSRRPQSPPNRNKFNLFRILG